MEEKYMVNDILENAKNSITTYSNTIVRRIYAFISAAYKMAANKGVVDMNLIVRKDIRCPKSKKADKNAGKEKK